MSSPHLRRFSPALHLLMALALGIQAYSAALALPAASGFAAAPAGLTAPASSAPVPKRFARTIRGQVQFLPDGRLLSFNGEGLRIWSGAGKLLRRLSDADDLINISLTPDGRFLAGGSYQGHFTIWSLADGRKLAEIDDPGNWPEGFALSPDGVYLSVCKLEPVPGRGLEFYLHGWDLRSHRLVQRLHVSYLEDVFPGHPPATEVAFHPHGGYLSAGVENMNEPGFATVRVRNLHRGRWAYELPGYLPLAYSPDGSSFLYTESVGKRVALRHWDLRRQRLRRLSPLRGSETSLGLESAALSPRGKYAAWLGPEELDHVELIVSETRSGKAVLRVQISDQADKLAFSPDETQLLVSSRRDEGFEPLLYPLP